MIAVTVNAKDCWLITAEPNTPEAVSLLPGVPLDVQRSLTGRGSRRPEANALSYAMEWTARVRGEEFHALRAAMREVHAAPVLAPVWPFAIRVGIDASVITAGLVVAWTHDWETVEINPASLAGFDFAAPAIYGYLTQPPRPVAVSDDLVTAEFSLEEDAPVSLAFAPSAGVLAADTNVNAPSGLPAPVFPFLPEPSTPAKPGLAVVEVQRTAIGPGRQKATLYYPQLAEETQEADYRLTSATEAARLIAWWHRRAGGAEAHWVAGTQKLGFLAADLAGGDNVLSFTSDIATLGGIGYVALFAPGRAPVVMRVASTAAQSVTLTSPLAAAWHAGSTTVATALLARHTQSELKLEFTRAAEGWHAETTLRWREVAAEYQPGAGETPGVTLGRLPGRAYFFELWLDYNGALQTWYLTNWESGAYANLINWEYNACDFDRSIQSVDLEDDSWTMTFRYFEGGPWDNWLPGRLSARGFIAMFRADVSAAGVFSNFVQLSKGEMRKPDIDGGIVKQKVSGANALFARRAPRQVMSPACGTMLFRPRCGLVLADWTFNAVIAAVAGNVVTIGTITRANAEPLPDGFGAAEWFALGWMGWIVAGMPYRDGVLTSTALAGGELVLTLDRPCGLGVGSNVIAAPGCDRLGATCRAKFDNHTRFRGFEFMPSVSPSFIMPQRNQSTAKK